MDGLQRDVLPWEALRHTEGNIPWDALHRFADALAEDPRLLRPLGDRLGELMVDPFGQGTYEALYVPAIVALAANRLDEEARSRAARFLIEALGSAGQQEDDFLALNLLAACETLGLDVVAPWALKALEDAPRENRWPLWLLMRSVRHSYSPELRERAIACARSALNREIRAGEDGDHEELDGAAYVLACLKHGPSRPLLKRALRATGSLGVEEALDVIDGMPPLDPSSRPGEPVRDWLMENRRSMADRYAQQRGEKVAGGDLAEPDEEEEMRRGEERAEELAAKFAESPAAAELPDTVREDAHFFADCLLKYARAYHAAAPEELTVRTLRDVLIGRMPEKVVADEETFANLVPVTQVLLGWLESEGVLAEVGPLIEAVGQWGDEIVSRAGDPTYWGWGKQFGMQAEAEGVDPSDRDAMHRFMMEYNRRILSHDSYVPQDEPDEPLADRPPVNVPIVNEGPKIGRNDPCPCGSGKKYKKCCGA